MNFRFITSFVAALALFSIIIRRSAILDQKSEEQFWEKESKANATRKKSLDQLSYIHIPEELLTMKPAHTNEELSAYLTQLNELSHETIVNLTGISNTDLKLTYGTANITILSQYDFHYTRLVTLLQKIAELLVSLDETKLAISVLEYAVSTGSDVSHTYDLLSKLYLQTQQPEKINDLILQASKLRSLMKDTIVRRLKASCQ